MSLGCLLADLDGVTGSVVGTLIPTNGGNITDLRSEQNLAAWYDASNAANLTLDGSNRVSQWNDTSPFASRHLLQGTIASQPVYTAAAGGSPAYVTFDGVDDWLKTSAFTLNQPETVYLVFQQVTWTLDDIIYDGDNVISGRMALYQSAATPALNMFAGTVLAAASPDVNALVIHSAVFNGASSLSLVNRGAVSSGAVGANNAGGFTLGAEASTTSRWSNIQVSACAIFSTAHDARTRARVINYLASKYNVPV